MAIDILIVSAIAFAVFTLHFAVVRPLLERIGVL